jgi:hypothetical protein
MKVLEQIRRPVLRLVGMSVMAVALAVPAFSYACARWTVLCDDGSTREGIICCGTDQDSWATCYCAKWSAESGYSDCRYDAGCYFVQ